MGDLEANFCGQHYIGSSVGAKYRSTVWTRIPNKMIANGTRKTENKYVGH